MSDYGYVSIEGDTDRDSALTRRLIAMPELLEVLMVEGRPKYLATVEGGALNPGQLENLIRRLKSVKGVRRVRYVREAV